MSHKLTCIVTGKTITVGNEYYDKKVSQFGNEDKFNSLYVSRQVKSLLKRGYKVKEIKEKNQFVLPENIRYKYPFLCSTNVFSEVKRLQNREIILINDLKILINERLIIEHKIEVVSARYTEDGPESNISHLETLLDAKKDLENNALTKIIEYRNQYIGIDHDFRKELEDNIKNARKQWFRCCTWLKT